MLSKKLLFRSEFNKNVATLFIGTTLAQAIPILLAPILTRIYEPAHYGEFSLFFSLTNILGIIAAGRYDMAIILPKEKHEADHLQILCYVISIFIGICLLIIVIFFKNQILHALGSPHFGFWLYFVPLNVVLYGFFQTITARFNRDKAFGKMTYAKITQNSVSVILSISLGLGSLLRNGLIVGHLIGFISAIFLFIRQTSIKAGLSVLTLRETAIKYNHFLLYNAPTALLNTIASALPIFYISHAASKAEVGFYGLVERVINAPIALIAYAVSQVLLEDVATRYREGRPIRTVLIKLLTNLFFIGVVPFSIIFFFAQDIFQLAFGPSWKEAGSYASILSVAFFMRFMVSPLSVVFISMNRLKRLTLWQTLYFVSTVGVVGFSYPAGNILNFLVLIAINDVILYSLYIYLIFSIVKK